MLRRLVRAAALASLTGAFLLVTAWVRMFLKEPGKRRHSIRIASYFCRMGLKVLGIKVEVEGDPARRLPAPCLLVGNHVSYVDVLMIGAAIPTAFVTSLEIAQTFFLGRICRLGGSLFVERRRRAKVREQLALLSRVLQEGIRVCLFAEGTSTNGDGVLHFKSSLIEAAKAAPCVVVPVFVHYTRLNGTAVTAANRDHIFYYGEMGFFKHLWGLLAMNEVVGRVVFLEPLAVGPSQDRKDLSRRVRSRLMEQYPILA